MRSRYFYYLHFKIFDVELPRLSLAERGLEALGERTLLLKMDVTFHVTGSSADGALVGVLCRGIEIDIVKYLSCSFR